MKILLIDHPWLARAFIQLGHEVFTCWSSKLNKINSDYWDLIIKADTSQPFINFDFLKFKGLKLFYSTDSHFHLAFQEIIGGCFDGVLVAQKNDVANFEKHNPHSVWMPLCADPQPIGFKHLSASFVGNVTHPLYSERRKFFHDLRKQTEILVTTGDWRSVYSASFMVVNKSVRGDLNFRIFEGLACRCLVLTDFSDQGLTDLFEPNEHLVVFNSVSECADLMNYYLNNHQQLLTIANRGHRHFLENHTTIIRARQILKFAREIQQRQLSQTEVEAAHMANLCWWIGVYESQGDTSRVEILKTCLDCQLKEFARLSL